MAPHSFTLLHSLITCLSLVRFWSRYKILTKDITEMILSGNPIPVPCHSKKSSSHKSWTTRMDFHRVLHVSIMLYFVYCSSRRFSSKFRKGCQQTILAIMCLPSLFFFHSEDFESLRQESCRDGAPRTLTTGVNSLVPGGAANMTIAGCTTACKSKNFLYAGTEYAQECCRSRILPLPMYAHRQC